MRLAVLFLLSGYWLHGQESIKTEMYLADFDFLIEKLVETHPDPYSAFGNQVEFYRAKQQLREEIKNVSDNEEFVIKLNCFLSNLEDGHTSVYLPKSIAKTLIKNLPLRFKVSSDYLFVQNSTKEFENYIGKSIIRINEKPIEELLQEIRNWYPTENISGAYYNLIRALSSNSSSVSLFGVTDKLEFTFGNPLEYTTIEIPFQSEVSFLPTESKIKQYRDKSLLYYSMLGGNNDIGYLKWNSIVSREVLQKAYQDNPENIENHWAYKSFQIERNSSVENDILQAPALYEQFYFLLNEMKERESKFLIIDLRNNGGGMTPLIKPLLYILYGDKYLNFDFNAEIIRKLSLLFLQKIGMNSIEDFNKAYYCDFELGDYTYSPFGGLGYNLTLEKKRNIVENGYYGFGAEYIIKANHDNIIKPEIIVLSSPTTYSAAYHFTYFLRKLGNTTVIGVSPRQAGNSFIETTPFELPRTKLHGSISNSKQILFKENLELGKLLKPDYELNWNDFKEYNFDKNTELLKALDLIEKGSINEH